MTLNFTSYSTFPSSIYSDDDFGSSIRDRTTAENCGGSYWLNWDADDPYENRRGGGDWADGNGSYDPIDLLPADPFGMDLSSTLSAAIAGWIEDCSANPSNYELYYWDPALLSSSEAQSGAGTSFVDWVDEGLLEFSGHEAQDGAFGSLAGVEGISNPHGSGEESVPHEGLLLSLGYLGVEDLLSVERVCRSLHTAVQSDPLLWRCIHIDAVLNDKITDDALLWLTGRAQGSLQCLSLMYCSKITNDGLKRVLESNLKLEKLSVSGCQHLTIEGLINNLKAFKASGAPGVKHLRLCKSFSVSQEHYNELQFLLGGDELIQSKACKPRFYHYGISSPACDDDRVIDIEMCPCCQKFKLVFDCPSESCRAKGPDQCRACDFCIGRCSQCGRCINDCRYEETFLLDYRCSGCPERLDK